MPPALRVRGREIPLGARPALMGIVNASPESFSDGGRHATLDERVELAEELVAAGAALIDVGGESGVTNQPAIEPAEEIARVVPLIERIAAAHPEVVVSVDTYKPAVAEAALAAGAAIVNDVSGLRDPGLADVCARHGRRAGGHAQPPPRPSSASRTPASTRTWSRRSWRSCASAWRSPRRPECPRRRRSSTPGRTSPRRRPRRSRSCAGWTASRPSAAPSCSPSRARTSSARSPGPARASAWPGRWPRSASPGGRPGSILRVHDVREVADYLTVADALDGEGEIPPDLQLAEDLRREPPAGS